LKTFPAVTSRGKDASPLAGRMPALLPAPMDLVDRRLIGAFDEHFVDADVRRTAGGPAQRFGDVLGGERVDPFIDFLRAFGVAFATDGGAFRFGQAGV